MIEPADWIGKQVGKYRIVRLIGRGGMGSVFEGVDRHLKRSVAIKLLPADKDALPRLLREARTAARVNHPNVVAVYDVGKHGKTLYLVMELIRGRTAHERVRDGGPLSETDANRLIVSVCKGLRAAHAAGLIHRDIKPGNILCPDGGEAQLVDFGLAKPAFEATGQLTHVNTLLGTPQFMSPEQCRCENLDERSDLYSLGATWFYLLTGRPPFESEDRLALLFSHCSDPPPDPRKFNPSVSGETATLVLRALAKSRSDRFADAHAMYEAITLISKEMPILIPVEVVKVVEHRMVRREPPVRWWPAFALVGLFALVVVATLIGRGRRESIVKEDEMPTVQTQQDSPPIGTAKKEEFPYLPTATDPLRAEPFWYQRGYSIGRFLPKSSRFAADDLSESLSVWFPPTNRSTPMKVPSGGIIDFAGFGNGNRLAVLSSTSTVTLYAHPDWKPVGEISLGKATGTCVVGYGDWLAVGTRDGLRFYDLRQFPQAKSLPLTGPLAKGVVMLRCSDDGSRLACVDAAGYVTMWATSDQRILMRCQVPEGEPRNLFFGTEQTRLVYLSMVGERSTWHRLDPGSRGVWTKINGPERVRFAAPLPTRNVLFLTDDRVGVFAPFESTPAAPRMLDGKVPTAGLRSFEVSPDGRLLMCGYDDRRLNLWRLGDGSE